MFCRAYPQISETEGDLSDEQKITGITDVIVIGAGAAGLTAAAELGTAGLRVTILEARNRVGGRIFTQTDPALHVPVELGAEFIHGRPAEIWNALEGERVRVSEVTGKALCFQAGRLQVCDFWKGVEAVLRGMDAQHPDESFSSYLRRFQEQSQNEPGMMEASQRALAYISGFNAADPDRVGVHWLVRSMRAEEAIDGDHTFRTENGYADLLKILVQRATRAGVVTKTGIAVDSVAWRAGHVKISGFGHDGPFQAASSRVLITPPLGVLKAPPDDRGGVHFSPSLPKTKLEAMQKLEMGKVIRVTLRFRSDYWERLTGRDQPLSGASFLFSDDEWFPTWWTEMPRRIPIITGWAPFRSAEKLTAQSDTFLMEHAMTTLGKLLGCNADNLQKECEIAYSHDWQSDPFSRGAYSYGAEGSNGAQAQLAAPVEDTLFFAGEATDTTGHNGTVHGAMASGLRAAREILAEPGAR